MAQRPSSITRLPPEIRDEIGKLREAGYTIDEILNALRELGADVSRSALGRHVKGLAELGERLRRSRQIADALVRRYGDAPESRAARLNIELMHSIIQDLFMGGEDGQPVTLDPENAMFLAKSLDHLGKAAKADADLTTKLREEARKAATAAAAKEAEKVAKEAGLSAATINAIKAGILGVQLPAPKA